MQSTLRSLTLAARTVPAAVRNHRNIALARYNRCIKALPGHKPAVTTVPVHAMATTAPASPAEARAMARFRQLVPTLGGNYKGAHGKVAVVGGCLEFTGAPFFAAMSALRVGADMAYVICTPSAATAIKSYSPELMVLPYLPEQQQQQQQQQMSTGAEGEGPVDQAAVELAVSRICPWLSRASALVVGPGLGGDPAVCATAAALMGEARRLGLPLLVDGSALTHIVAKNAATVSGYRSCILTPNVAELGRIAEAVGLRLPGKMSDACKSLLVPASLVAV